MKLLARTRQFPCHAWRTIRWPENSTGGTRTCPECKTRWTVTLAHASTQLEASVGCDVYRIRWDRA